MRSTPRAQLKLELTGKAEEELTTELASIRDSALDSLKSQKADLESGFQAAVNSTVEELHAHASLKVDDAQNKQKIAEEESARLRARYPYLSSLQLHQTSRVRL